MTTFTAQLWIFMGKSLMRSEWWAMSMLINWVMGHGQMSPFYFVSRVCHGLPLPWVLPKWFPIAIGCSSLLPPMLTQSMSSTILNQRSPWTGSYCHWLWPMLHPTMYIFKGWYIRVITCYYVVLNVVTVDYNSLSLAINYKTMIGICTHPILDIFGCIDPQPYQPLNC